MKTNFTFVRVCLLGFISIIYLPSFSQLTNGGFHANFGVDADTKSDYIKYGSVTGNIKSDDWFAVAGTSKGVIDTTGAAYYAQLLKSNTNISFVKKMSAPLFAKLNNTLWIDAVYCRDFVKTPVLPDSTAFISACKNGADPSTWLGGAANVSNKNDLLDVFTHMRRNGITITDSLWLFTAASTTGTTGSRYYDVELFKNSLGYNTTTGSFTSGGPDAGHTQWLFDASGKIIQTGDMIVAITYNPGTAPIIEVRIWVSRVAFNTLVPALFNFDTQFDAASGTSPYGYASIVSKAGRTAFGAGAGNYTATATDTTYSTPWGTYNTTWDANYQPLQLVEIGINLTRIGLDPSLYSATAAQACGSFFKSIFYKSRSSASFASNLNDFVGPLDFMSIPVLDHTIKTDTLSCKKPVGALKVTSNTTAALYQWKTPAGVVLTGTSVAMNKPGMYILQSTIATGCPVGKTDTVMVLADTLKPVATANLTANMLGQVQLLGGDPVASNYPTPFGGSLGLSYSWTGPLSFTSILRNPMISTYGTYNITVTELRNGCTSTATVSAQLAILEGKQLVLKGRKASSDIRLEWNTSCKEAGKFFEIQRSVSGGPFLSLATLQDWLNSTANGSNTYADKQQVAGELAYRIKETSVSGAVSYSNVVVFDNTTANHVSGYFSHQPGKFVLVIDESSAGTGTVIIYTVAGQVLTSKKIKLQPGHNVIEIGTTNTNDTQLKVGTVYLDNKVAFSSTFR